MKALRFGLKTGSSHDWPQFDGKTHPHADEVGGVEFSVFSFQCLVFSV